MSKDYLPLKLDPIRFADHATQLHGRIPLKNMERLNESLANNEGEAQVDINFGIDQEGIRNLQAHIQSPVNLQCQRCMDTFEYEIISDLTLGIVQTEEEAANLPGRYDPLIVKSQELNIQDIIEDELIISLPIVPMHNPNNCKVQLPLITESETDTLEKANPFNVIKVLRKNKD